MLNMIKMTGLFLMIAALSACGGGDGFSGGTDPDGGGTPTPTPGVASASLRLLVSSPEMASDGSTPITLTALVRDANNNFVEGSDIQFAATSGGVKVTAGTTDEDGRATGQLSTGGDQTNRIITVTATEEASGLTAVQNIQVKGTKISITGAKTLNLSQTTALTLVLADSGGNPIANQTLAVTSALGNTLSAASLTTDFAGAATVNVTATAAGSDTISATALGTTGSFALTVAAAGTTVYGFTAPASTDVDINAAQPLEVCWTDAGAAQVGRTITFTTTRGVFASSSTPVATAVTAGNGCATVSVSSTIAGPASVMATAGTLAAVQALEFVATTPAAVKTQASPSVVSGGQKSTITATVRDASYNLVKNRTVVFSIISDPTSGSISPATGETDSFGQVTTVYTAGAVSSGRNNVTIRANVLNSGAPPDEAELTVVNKALSVALGTGNSMSNYSETVYSLPYAAIVTNSAGGPVANQPVSITVWSKEYYKGSHYGHYNSTGSFVRWANTPRGAVGTGAGGIEYTCQNEDRDTNGIFDAPEDSNDDGILDTEDLDGDGVLDDGEDANGNGKLDTEDRNGNGILDAATGPDVDVNSNGILDPGNIATINNLSGSSAVVLTNSEGIAEFNILYPEEYAYWLSVVIEARVSVDGTEDMTRASLTLPGINSDFNTETVAPPGPISPFGRGYDFELSVAQDCAVDERF